MLVGGVALAGDAENFALYHRHLVIEGNLSTSSSPNQPIISSLDVIVLFLIAFLMPIIINSLLEVIKDLSETVAWLLAELHEALSVNCI